MSDRSLEEMEFEKWWSSPEVMDGPYLSLKEGMFLAWKTRSRLSVQGEELPERPKVSIIPNHGSGFSAVYPQVIAEQHFYDLEAEIGRLKGERDLLLWADSAKGKQLLEYHEALSASRADALKAVQACHNKYGNSSYHDGVRDAEQVLARMEKAW